MKTLAWLFDIDGTLLTTDGAAMEAFAAAVHETFGIDDDLSDIPFAGRTEPLIVGDILAKHGRRFEDGEEQRFWATVFDEARRRLRGRGRVMPGVPALLDRVDARTDWLSGLLTGNMTQMARIKLERFGLHERFAFGAFGEMAADRNALARQTVERLQREHGIPPERCIIVGDTENDIACARAAGIRVAAVATGTRSREQLAAREPDLLLDDLSDPRPLLEWAEQVEAGR